LADHSGSAPAQPPATSELKLRIISAVVLAVVVLGAAWAGGWPFKLVWAAVGALMTYEWLRIMGAERPLASLSAASLAASATLYGVISFGPMALFVGAIVAAIAGSPMQLRRLGALGVLYGAVIAFGPAILRGIPVHGLAVILWSFAVVWTTDVVAYFTGKAIGGPKLSPRFSPKKTWSGAVGGAVGGTLLGMLVWWGASHSGSGPLPIGLAVCALISLIASMLGQIGDIAESAFKRRFGVKDSGVLIPGHGGFMDRLDAYWAVIAFAVMLVLAGRFM
jgi:phosphatidate cytidylyltransferase